MQGRKKLQKKSIKIVQVEFFPDRSSQTELAFKLLDINKDGFITKEEFIKVLLVMMFHDIIICFRFLKHWILLKLKQFLNVLI